MHPSDDTAPTDLGWGLVGTGVLADVSIAPGIESTVGSHLSAVCSRTGSRADEFAAKHGARAAYDDYSAMLADDSVDIVYIASPNSLHAAQTTQALEAGKHVLVEKPMALDAADSLAMVRLAATAGLCLGVGFHLRHKATAIAGREAIADGRIGGVFYAEMAIGAGKGLYPYDTWRADPTLAGGGSLLSTSRPAPPSWPLRSASASAGSSIRPPRAVFSSKAPGFICDRNAASTSLSVCGVNGQCRLITSAAGNNDAIGTRPD